MTIVDQITREAKSLGPAQQRRALQLIRTLRSKPARKQQSAKSSAKCTVDKRKLHPALRAIVGMWKDRIDLPNEGAAASKVLRRRLMGRE